ncbi:hypothetical protein C8J56DRAFT_937343 [Mycena floridula]|nr:hypothetical protein C8J56DRAFT_937343 [Mycena floridula]
MVATDAEDSSTSGPAPSQYSRGLRYATQSSTILTESAALAARKMAETDEENVEEEEEADEARQKSESFQFVPANFTAKPEPKSRSPVPAPENENHGWKHPAELVYPIAPDWPDDKLFDFIIDNAFTISPRPPSAAQLFTITCSLGTIQLPSRYRIPLIWVAKYLWVSVKLVMTADESAGEWETYRLSILFVAQLCARLLQSAHEAALNQGMDKKWRCPTFDRVLTRFHRGFLMNDPATVEEFWKTFGEREYKVDILKSHWKNWVLKGESGFHVTEAELAKGITKKQFIQGLRLKKGKWVWDTNREAPAIFALQDLGSMSPSPPPQPQPAPRGRPPTVAVKKEAIPSFAMGSLGSLTPPPPPRVRVKKEPIQMTVVPLPPQPVRKRVVKPAKPKEPVLVAAPCPDPLWSSAPVPAKPKPKAPIEAFPRAPPISVPVPAPGPITHAIPPTPLSMPPALSQFQTQIDALRDGIRLLREEQARTEEEHRLLRSEHSASQYELHSLKRKFSETYLPNKRVALASPSNSNCISMHPLLHLLNADVWSDPEDDDDDEIVCLDGPPVKADPDAPGASVSWSASASGPLKSQRKFQKYHAA